MRVETVPAGKSIPFAFCPSISFYCFMKLIQYLDNATGLVSTVGLVGGRGWVEGGLSALANAPLFLSFFSGQAVKKGAKEAAR